MKSFVSSLVIGLTAGIFGGLVGVGGGIVMIPLMVRFAGLRQHQAHGTSLLALVFTGLGGAATYAGQGAVDVAAAASLAVTAIATARLGARHAHALPEWKLKRAFGGFQVAVAALLLAKPYLAGASVPAVGFSKLAVLIVTGGFTGFLSGMMGVGGGSLMVPAMVLLTGFPQVLAQGSSLLAMVPAGLAGAHQHWQLGNVVRRLLVGLVPGILLGTWLGSSLALQLTDVTLRFAFAGVVTYTGVRYLRAPRPAPAPAAAGV
ncbi:sulfite exporter TauE/SafE family protein [Anaeromyxobacter sp. Fw109-5]|uniref:sulfite exporter TauE/SafE family protein n=1 Tax=Anaeromyxobacter sp. (strain Fw109-5) TaxID=404589 RepID=UPI0002FDABF5|nr:sulfite exporter TauE/SafE family protein [Anaeromyxobacter sp. Fw109-5]